MLGIFIILYKSQYLLFWSFYYTFFNNCIFKIQIFKYIIISYDDCSNYSHRTLYSTMCPRMTLWVLLWLCHEIIVLDYVTWGHTLLLWHKSKRLYHKGIAVRVWSLDFESRIMFSDELRGSRGRKSPHPCDSTMLFTRL